MTTAVVLSGCATGSGDATTSAAFSAPPSAAGGSLTVMGFGADDEIGSTRLQLATAALNGTTVDLVKGDLDVQAFLSSVAAGDPPEIIYANRDQIGTFASRGAILPLTDCITQQAVDTGQYLPSALAQVTLNGTVYAIPEFNSVQIVMANRSLLDEAGLAMDDVNGSDWQALTAAASKLTKTSAGKLSVIGVDSKLPEFLPLWAKANGADLLSADGRTAQLDDPKVVQALNFAVGVYDTEGGFPAVKAFRDSADFFGEGNQYASGSLGAMPMEQWYVNVLNEVSPEAPMAFDTVRTPAGDTLAYASGSSWAVPKGSSNPGAACTFVKIMTRTDTWMQAAKARADDRAANGLVFTGLLTGNTVADEQIRDTYVTEPTSTVWGTAISAMYEANAHTFGLPANPADAEFKAAWQDAVNRVLNGQQEPADALAQAQREAQAALDTAWATWDEQGG
ncbi:ABC transporter substrate-binding protein [Nakamurella alba]|uniref:ABC transporter substrate-binding protein n=1 Tax=Nakamurella alba TaxID=2665158 RepID=UPI002AC32BA2|nr:extracellular solute-binding protein [Nakamurella alba]